MIAISNWEKSISTIRPFPAVARRKNLSDFGFVNFWNVLAARVQAGGTRGRGRGHVDQLPHALVAVEGSQRQTAERMQAVHGQI